MIAPAYQPAAPPPIWRPDPRLWTPPPRRIERPLALAAVTFAVHVWTTTAGDKTTAAFTPAANDLLVVFAASSGLAGGTTAISDSLGGTWVQVDIDRTGFSTTGVLTAWIRTTLVPASSMTVTAAQAGSTGGGLYVLRVAGMTNTGAAALRSSGGQSSGTAGTTPAPVLSLTPLTTNPILTAVANQTAPATMTPPTGYTQDQDSGYSTPTTGASVAHKDSGVTNATITWGSTSSLFASMALELDASAPAAASLVVDQRRRMTIPAL